MITSEIVEVYFKFQGNDDGLFRAGSKAEQKTVGAWHLIGRFEQRLIIIKRGLASAEFEAEVLREIQQDCDSQETVDKLLSLAANHSTMPPPEITRDLVIVFSKYHGNADRLSQSGSEAEKSIATPEAWALLTRLVKQQAKVNAWQATPEIALRLNEEIKAKCDSRFTAEAINQLASQLTLT